MRLFKRKPRHINVKYIGDTGRMLVVTDWLGVTRICWTDLAFADFFEKRPV